MQVDAHVDVDGAPDVLEAPHPLSVVYGGGGVFGIAYGLGVANGLADVGVPVATAPSLGTSAGSWVASAVALGIGYERFAGMVSPSVPTRDPVLVEAARAVFGDARHHLVAVSAVLLRSRRRHILDGAVYDLADLAAASSAVPGIFPPHRIEGRLYVDGGMWSATSVDAAAEADEVIVVAPLAGPVMGPMGRTAGLLLGRELQTWRKRHPGKRITMIRPDHAIGRMAGRNPLGLFDADRAREVSPVALEQGRRWGERLLLDPAS
ncbi:MAG: patatin-like phospholipase family protein [Acidimicrobiales bacterium]